MLGDEVNVERLEQGVQKGEDLRKVASAPKDGSAAYLAGWECKVLKRRDLGWGAPAFWAPTH